MDKCRRSGSSGCGEVRGFILLWHPIYVFALSVCELPYNKKNIHSPVVGETAGVCVGYISAIPLAPYLFLAVILLQAAQQGPLP